jgi:hypothetical protein
MVLVSTVRPATERESRSMTGSGMRRAVWRMAISRPKA